MSYQQYRPNSFNILPLVVKNLFIINALFLFATFVLGNNFSINIADTLGLHFPASEKFRPYQLITYMFMHADFSHLFSNMLSLWIFGSMIEYYWGPKRFLIYYLITGIGAALVHYIILYYGTFHDIIKQIESFDRYQSVEQFITFFHSLPQIPISENMRSITENFDKISQQNTDSSALPIMSNEILFQYKTDLLNMPVIVGASGSVFGVLLAYGMLFPNATPFLLIPVKAKWIVLFYGIGELFTGIANNPGDNVAHFAHLGGMLFGFILIKYWQKNNKSIW